MVCTVFRVENRDGVGPYNYKDYRCFSHRLESQMDTMGRIHSNSKEEHPVGHNDGLIWIEFEKHNHSASARYGFKDHDSYIDWFSGYFELLNECGFCLAEYRVPQRYIQHGNSKKQLVFDKNKANLIKKHKIKGGLNEK